MTEAISCIWPDTKMQDLHAFSAAVLTALHLCMQRGSVFRGTFDFQEDTFDWGSNYQRPNLAPQDLVVYEMGVRSYTADSSSGVGKKKEGTYAGMIDKVGWQEWQECQNSAAHDQGHLLTSELAEVGRSSSMAVA